MTMIHLAPGTTLRGGTYSITRFISSGGFGCTYEGKHTMLGKRVAIKEFFVKDFCNRNETSGSVEIGTRSKEGLVGKLKKKFIEEACVLSQYEHPNIVHVSDVFEENGTAYYVMDYIDGESLHEKVQRHGHLDEKQALDYILQVADALEYVHNHNRLHLDVKPGNIMVAPGNRAVLIDFGISKHYDDVSGENTSTMLGVNTPGYAPHEQITQSLKTFSPATDIYALGATFYKLLTGVTPPNSVSLMGDEETLAPLPSAISATIRNAVECAMAVKRKDRPQTIAEFRRLLEEKHGEKQENVMDETVLDGGICSGQVSTTSGMKYVVYGNSGTYSGGLLNGIPHGSGTFVYDDGRKYVGEFKNGKRHGQGTLVWKDGDKYVGEFKEGKLHGQGTYTWTSGSKYVGEWKDGSRTGQGAFIWKDGDKYVGEFKEGKLHGQGTCYFSNGNKYVGEWKDDSRTGQGTFIWKDGDKYVGGFKDNKKSGQGTFIWGKNSKWAGDKYVGEWKDDRRTGQGTYYYSNGNKYIGEWKDDKINGQGTYYNADGTIWRKGLWENGEFVE